MSAAKMVSRTRRLAAIWSLLWMVLAAPCAMAGDPGAATGAQDHPGAHAAAGGDTDAADLLCLHDCAQTALGHGLQEAPSPTAPVALAGASPEEGLPAPALGPAAVDRDGDPPHPRVATFLLNQTFLI